jgi:ubiquitin-like protein Pup
MAQKQKTAEKTETEEKAPESKDIKSKGEDIKEELDELVDEIDEVLEENAAEFVKNYVQRGGE